MNGKNMNRLIALGVAALAPACSGPDDDVGSVAAPRAGDTARIERAATAACGTIYDNWNTGQVFDVPATSFLQGDWFTLHASATINEIDTYHFHNGAGATPGAFYIFDRYGSRWIGPFGASGVANPSGAIVNWVARPNLFLGPGNYFLYDSGQAVGSGTTWSQNAQSGGLGFARMTGTGGGAEISNNTNTDAVFNGATSSNLHIFTTSQVTQFLDYHWNGGAGVLGSSIEVRTPGGAILGQYATHGETARPGTPDVSMVADICPPLILQPGDYTVVDHSPAWSYNARSGFQGFVIARGF